MKIAIKILLILLSVAYGGLFIYSAYTKSFPIFSFEYTLVEFLHMPWFLAAVAARFFIGLEFGLGVLIALNLYGERKWILKVALWLLVVFSAYLIYLWAKYGNSVNCGCFGDAIWMSPGASLVKNAVLLLFTFILLKFNPGLQFKSHILGTAVLVTCIILPFILIAIPPSRPNWLKKDSYMMDFSALYMPSHTPVSTDLRKGKHIVAYFSQGCPHCRLAAYKMHLMKEADTSLPLFMIIGGESDLTAFWKATKAQNIPCTRLDKEDFLQITGGIFPLIVWVNDSKVEAKSEYINLSQEDIKKWAGQ